MADEQPRRAGNSRLVYDKVTRTIRPERTPADFSREFAGYMAKAAERVLASWITHPEAFDDEARSDDFRELESAIYEWRKREAVAQGTGPASAPAAEGNDV